MNILHYGNILLHPYFFPTFSPKMGISRNKRSKINKMSIKVDFLLKTFGKNQLLCLFLQTESKDMERNLLIELLEDGDKVSLYSQHFEGEEYSEFEKFLLTFKDTYPDDVRQLVYRLDIIKRDGAADRHFRYEGTRRDRVMALPSHLETTSLRLYLLNIQAKILILGNGRLKTTATYEEDDNLHKCVKTLQKIDIEIKERERKKMIVVTGTELFGELSFSIDDE